MILYKNDWYELTRTPTGVFRLERLGTPFAGVEDLAAAHDALLDLLESNRPRALLVDLRNAKLRGEPEFEREFAQYRARISKAAPRVAMLVKSKIGALQVQRLAKNDQAAGTNVFDDEAAALGWLAVR